MIKINDRYELERDKYQWILTEWVDGFDKDKKPKRSERKTYHPLKWALNEIIDREAGRADSVEGVIEAVEKAERSIVFALSKLEAVK